MALQDKPEIDTSDINCIKSEQSLERLLNDHIRFIARKENPDKGCDYMCEIVVSSGADASKFPIQLKSIETLTLVDSNTMISYPVLTSRLGYMLRHLPTTGIFVFYSVERDQCYYDFSDAIYERLMTERKSDEWINNKKVNIRISLANVLDENAINLFHETIKNRFTQARKMQLAYGERYGLPTIDLYQDHDFDFENPDHLKRLLREYGTMFLSSYNLIIISTAIEKLSNSEINNDKDLLLLAANTYCEIGKYIESDLYLRKVKSKFVLTTGEEQEWNYVNQKNMFQRGMIGKDEFLTFLKLIKNDNPSRNEYFLDINILRYELAEVPPSLVNISFKNELERIFKTIKDSNLSNSLKNIYTIWNSENEAIVITHDLSYNIGRYKLRAISGGDSKEFLNEFVSKYNSEVKIFTNRLNELYDEAVNTNNQYIEAAALAARATFFIHELIISLSQKFQFENLEERLKKHFQIAMLAAQKFEGIGLLKDAHYSLNMAIEILEAAKGSLNSDVADDLKKLKDQSYKLQNSLLIEPYEHIIPSIFEDFKKQNEKSNKPPMSSLVDMTEDSLIFFAEQAIDTLKLDPARFKNVLAELKAYKLFYQRCKNKDIEILQNNSSKYLYPVTFTLRNKKTNEFTFSSHDMERLLSSIGL